MSLYVLGYFVAVTALGLWFGYRTDSSKRKVFLPALLLGLGLFLSGLLFADQSWLNVSKIAARDLLILAGTGFLFQLLPSKKGWFWVGTALILSALWFAYRPAMQHAYQATNSPFPQALDENGELLVELKEGSVFTDLEGLVKRYDLSGETAFAMEDTEQTLLDNYLVVNVPTDYARQLDQIKSELSAHPAVEWVEDNELIQLDPQPVTLPNRINRKAYGINDPGLEQLWGFEAMKVDQIYRRIRDSKLKPKKKAVIAILDTGVDGQHEDLKANYTSTQTKYDDDPRGHGTHCAGIAGAVSNNGVGVASLAPDNGFVQITSIKVLNGFGMGTQRTIVNGILEAADRKADVLSLSLGGPSSDSKQRAYEKAIKYAKKKGAIVVVAAGNSNRNAKYFAPANARGAITVAAIGEDRQKAVFSNTVQDLDMGLAAPGVGIYSTIPGSQYETYNGTSMATPYVAGLAGLMKSLRPKLTSEEFYRIVHKTGSTTNTPKETGRIIQPNAAVGMLLGVQ